MSKPDDETDKGEGHPAGDRFRMPLTTSNASLLKEGSDVTFRQFIYDLTYLGTLIDAGRRHLAIQLGVTPPQYNILMVLAEQGAQSDISVSDVAEQLHVSGAFVTVESGKLVASGFVEKVPNPHDRRGILLRLTQRAQIELDRVAEEIRAFNDCFFESVSAKDFERLRSLVGKLVQGGEAALRTYAEPAIMGRSGRRRALSGTRSN